MKTDELSAISRRDLLAGAAVGLAAGASLRPSLSGAATAASTAAGPAMSPIMMHRKLKFRTDAGLVFWWLRGIKYGQVGTDLTPLFTNHTGTIQHVQPTEDGGFDLTSLEITVATAIDSDAPLSEWKNPYTGEVLPIRVRPLGPTTVHYRADDSREVPETIGGAPLEATSEIQGPFIVGDDVFISEVIKAKVFRPGSDGPYVVNDLSHVHGSLAELANPDTTTAEATVSFAEATGWQKWMNMGTQPGTLTSRTFGKKATAFSEMPEAWIAALEATVPELAAELAADPLATLSRPAAKFDR